MSSETANADWVTVVGTLGGAVVGAVIGYLATSKQVETEARRERQRFMLSKLEALFTTVTEARSAYDHSYGDAFLRLCSGSLPSTSVRVPIEQLEMLVGFYGRPLQPLLQNAMRCREEYGAVLGTSVGQERESEQVRKTIRSVLTDRFKALDAAFEKLQGGIIAEAQKYQ